MAQVIGFIGLGMMGRPKVENLRGAGSPLIVYSRRRGPVSEVSSAGATAGSSPKDLTGVGE
jgi:3-hydroxyisobutyrate dehydrogenase-like beta-hydroxyacid dehydrogenase